MGFILVTLNLILSTNMTVKWPFWNLILDTSLKQWSNDYMWTWKFVHTHFLSLIGSHIWVSFWWYWILISGLLWTFKWLQCKKHPDQVYSYYWSLIESSGWALLTLNLTLITNINVRWPYVAVAWISYRLGKELL